MACHGVQGRGVLVDLRHHLGDDWRGVDLATLREIMAADNVVVEPGDMLLLHTGFATRILEWDRKPDPQQALHDLQLPRRPRRGAARVDRRLADLRAGRRQLRGRGAARQGPGPEPALVPADPPPVPVQARRPAGGDVVPARAGGVAARARPQPVPADRAAAAAARDRRLAADPGRDGLRSRQSETPCSRWRRRSAITCSSFGRPAEFSRYLRGLPGMLAPK